MKHFISLLMLGLMMSLGGCAHQAYQVDPNCALPGDDAVLLNLDNNGSRSQLILHVQSDGTAVTFVALNPVGAPLFNGVLEAGEITAATAPGYRGADPRSIIWGYSLWRLRDQAQTCWTRRGNQLTTPDGGLELRAGNQLLARWQPQAAQIMDLPWAGLQISLRQLD